MSDPVRYTIGGAPTQTLRGTEKSKSEWVIAWHRWFFGIEAKDNPSYGPYDYSGRSIYYNQGRYPPEYADTKGKVYFLAGAAGTTFTTRSIIPYDSWQCIVVPVYTMSASADEFPSLSPADLKNLVEKDVQGATEPNFGELKAELDGRGLPRNEIEQIIIYEPFTVGLPDENILNVDVPYTKMITNGYWMFLDPEQID